MGRLYPLTLLVFLVLHLSVRQERFSFVLSCQIKERDALLKLKQSFDDPANRLSSWKGQDCCQWRGVMCDNVTDHVITLNLRNPGQIVLSSPKLDPSLIELRRLTYLDLSGNYFQSSQIPGFIGLMKDLRYLNLSLSGFTGVIPPQLGNLTRLRTLDLGDYVDTWSIFDDKDHFDTFFSSSQPLVVNNLEWVSRLSDLQYLGMSVVDLTEANTTMQALNKLPLLSELHLRGCLLGNVHLSNAFSNSTNPFPTLHHLDLSYNIFDGSLPRFFTNLTSLKSLNLFFNAFNGSIPLWLTETGALESLNLARNYFSQIEGGTIMGMNPCNLKVLNLSQNMVLGGELAAPNEVFSQSQCKLESLDLRLNNISGTLPYWLGELRNLRFLDLGMNSFLGPVPSSIGNLSLLEELHLNVNGFSGSVPLSLGNLSLLEELLLNDNGFSGSVPSSLGKLSSLKILDLSSNFLQGTVSESHFANLSSLDVLHLHENSLKWELSPDWMPPFQLSDLRIGSCEIDGGQFPQWIQTQKRLNWLDLSSTGISGNLPIWFWNINFQGLNLSHNHITGPITHFSSLLEILNLSHNSFSGPLPTSCQMRNLEFLDLSKNEISGTIPNCLCGSESMTVINLSYNKFTGPIPESISLNSGLLYLKLSQNSLEGQIPASLSNCIELLLLDIGENKLSGKIPSWGAETYPSLQLVRLRDNQLSGAISQELCSLPQLKILDLAQNNLTGNIPRCFGHFSAMSLIHSDNGFDGLSYENPEINAIEIMKGKKLEYTTILQLVMNLDLSGNGLVGTIPEELTNLKGLQGLNLSHNHLVGNIPKKIGEMSSLESLDLSTNRLSGTIPPSMSGISSLSHLNLSSNRLHGEIPTGNQLQTLNDPSIYSGNLGLCGDPLPNKCTRDYHDQQQQQQQQAEEEEDNGENVVLYIFIVLGFVTGFWGVIGALLLKKRWRHAVFLFVEDVTDYIYVQVVVRIKKPRN